MRACKSVSFSHIILWNFISNLDIDGQSLSMKTVDFLQTLTDQGRFSIERIQNAHLYPIINSSSDINNYISYKGLNFDFEELRPEVTLMSKLNSDCQNSLFFSTPLFISNLISISEYLRTLPLEQRGDKLKFLLTKLNECLPNNVYVPMK